MGIGALLGSGAKKVYDHNVTDPANRAKEKARKAEEEIEKKKAEEEAQKKADEDARKKTRESLFSRAGKIGFSNKSKATNTLFGN